MCRNRLLPVVVWASSLVMALSGGAWAQIHSKPPFPYRLPLPRIGPNQDAVHLEGASRVTVSPRVTCSQTASVAVGRSRPPASSHSSRRVVGFQSESGRGETLEIHPYRYDFTPTMGMMTPSTMSAKADAVIARVSFTAFFASYRELRKAISEADAPDARLDEQLVERPLPRPSAGVGPPRIEVSDGSGAVGMGAP